MFKVVISYLVCYRVGSIRNVPVLLSVMHNPYLFRHNLHHYVELMHMLPSVIMNRYMLIKERPNGLCFIFQTLYLQQLDPQAFN